MALLIQRKRKVFLSLYSESGMTVDQIKDKMNVSKDTVYRHLKAQGIVFNPSKGGRKKAIAQGEEGGAIA